MNRRDMMIGAGALIGATTLAGGVAAQSGSEISNRARSLFRRGVVLDANLGPPITSDQPLPQAVLDAARDTGVSAIKTTIGGFNAPFEDTLAEIAFYQRLI